ncbi:CARDB domain-containing protein [Natronobiforma cellulositropha]|uniref:CARDB domain-containing protein n=1 Tax=Natronobiforma cellulositropha TaxID=1679076 RepID=UPI0021D58277|nr:CARDB domain-containing protein [Natronobiforma cellulositropha]
MSTDGHTRLEHRTHTAGDPSSRIFSLGSAAADRRSFSSALTLVLALSVVLLGGLVLGGPVGVLADSDDANFSITDFDVDESVLVGETITVSYEINNTGTENSTRDIHLTVDGEVKSSDTDVFLNQSETTSGTLTYETSESDRGTLEVGLTTGDDDDSAPVEVNAEAEFMVSIDDVNEPVEGEDLVVTAFVENVGDETATQTVTLTRDDTGAEVDDTDITLDGEDNTTTELTLENAEAGSFNVTVSSEDDSATETATVLTEASYEIDALEADNVTQGETLTVNATVTNTGDVNGTARINATLGDNENTEEVDLEPSETKTASIDLETTGIEPGEVTVEVDVDGETKTTNATIHSSAFYAVEDLTVNDTVVGGESLTVEALINNTGTADGDRQAVTLEVDGEEVDTTNSTLDGNADQTVELTWDETDEHSGDNVTVLLSSEDTDASATVQVLEPANLSITSVGTDNVTQGEPLEVQVGITNDGDVNATADVTATVESVENTESVTVPGSETVSTTVVLETESLEPGPVDIVVEADGDEETTEARVLRPANFSVTIDEGTNESVKQGQELTVFATIENRGEVEGTQSIDFSFDGETVGSRSVTLDPDGAADDAEMLEFVYNVPSNTSIGETPISVSSANETATRNVSVEDGSSFDLEIDENASNDSVMQGETLTVIANVTNTGTASGTDDIWLDATTIATDGDGEVVKENVTVNKGSTERLSFKYLVPDDAETEQKEILVNSASHGTSQTFTVEISEGSSFQIDPIENKTSRQGESFEVTTNVTNTGPANATKNITLEAEGDLNIVGEETIEQTLFGNNGSAQVSYTLEIPDDHPTGTLEVNISSEDDSQVFTLTVEDGSDFQFEPVDNKTSRQGESFEVTTNVTNTGPANATKNITLEAEGDLEIEEDTIERTLSGDNATVEVTFEVTVPDDHPLGPHEMNISSEDDWQVFTLTVEDGTNIEVGAIDSPAIIGHDELLTVSTTISNDGPATSTQNVTLRIDGVVQNSTSIELGSNAIETVTFTDLISSSLEGNTTLEISSTRHGQEVNESTTVEVIALNDIAGTVIDGLDGGDTPAANVPVAAHPEGEVANAGTNETLTNQAGEFALRLVSGQAYELRATKVSENTTIIATETLVVDGDKDDIELELTPELDGNGTADEPFQITTVGELQWIDRNRSAHYELRNTLNASETATWNGGAGFEPIGSEDDPFTGHFDGNGHVISSLTVDRTGQDRVGLFGEVGGDGTVERVGLANVSVTGGDEVGGLVGRLEGGVERSWVDGSVLGNERIGGLAGNNRGSVGTSASYAAVSGVNEVGGLVGFNDADLDEVVAVGTIENESIHVGGLAGRTTSSGNTIGVGYWDTDSTGVDTDGTSNAIGLSTSELTGVASQSLNLTYDDGEWLATDSYPVHRWRVAEYNLSVKPDQLPDGGGADPTVTVTLVDGNTVEATKTAVFTTSPIDSGAEVSVDEETKRINSTTAGSLTVTAADEFEYFDDSVEITVLDPAEFEVKVTAFAENIRVGDEFSVTVTVNNTVADRDEKDVELKFPDGEGGLQIVAAENLNLGPDEKRENITLTWTVDDALESGTYDVEVATDDDSETFEVEVYGLQSVTGVVTDELAGETPAGVEVEATPRDGSVSTDVGTLSTETDSSGQYALQLIDGVEYNLTATRTATEGTTLVDHKPVAVDGSTEVDFSLAPEFDGDGTSDAPFEISNVYELQGVASNLSAHYTVVEDIDASETALWNDGDGFEPVGNESVPFEGAIEGNGHVISNLTIDRNTTQNVGLFGVVGEHASVESLVLENVNVSGSSQVGAIAGESHGDIRLVGTSGDVSGNNNVVGGIIGKQEEGGTLEMSYAQVNVSGANWVGGVAGENLGTVEEVYAAGTVTAEGGNNIGGIAGDNFEDITTAYWDKDVSGFDESDDGETPLSTDEMTGSAVVESMNLSFYESWIPTDGYPALSHQSALEGTGEADDPYRITSARDLQEVLLAPDKHYELQNDIDASATADWDGSGFEPIGNEGRAFTGTFDGNGSVIDGLVIDRDDEYVGLFGVIGSGGTVENVRLADASIDGPDTVGGIAGKNHGTIYAVGVSGSVGPSNENTNGRTAGGIAGVNDGTIEQSYVSASVSGSQAGGLVGGDPKTLRNSYWNEEIATDISSDSNATTTDEVTGSSALGLGLDFEGTWAAFDDEEPRLADEVEDVTVEFEDQVILPGSSTNATVEVTLRDGISTTATETARYSASPPENVTIDEYGGGRVDGVLSGEVLIEAAVGNVTGQKFLEINTKPEITEFTAENTINRTVAVSFQSSLPLENITASVTRTHYLNGTVPSDEPTQNLTEFSETRLGDNYVYTTTFDGDEEGRYNVTLEEAVAGPESEDGAESNSSTVILDDSLPAISSFEVTNPVLQQINISFQSDRPLEQIVVDIEADDGSDERTLTDFHERDNGDGTYLYTKAIDGHEAEYNVTLRHAEDADGNDGAFDQSREIDLGTEPPEISDFVAENIADPYVAISFTSEWRLEEIEVAVQRDGETIGSVDEDDASFSETEIGGRYEYSVVYDTENDDADGERAYVFTLVQAIDGDDADGAIPSQHTETVVVDPELPVITAYEVANPDAQNVTISFRSDESLTEIEAIVSGAENATLTEANFTATVDEWEWDTRTYTATYVGGSSGEYTVTLERAINEGDHNGASGQVGIVSIESGGGGAPVMPMPPLEPEPETPEETAPTPPDVDESSVDIGLETPDRSAISVRNASAGEAVRIDPSEQHPLAVLSELERSSVRALSITLNEDVEALDIGVSGYESADALLEAGGDEETNRWVESFQAETRSLDLGYLVLEYAFDPALAEGATVEYAVEREVLEEAGTGPEHVSLYRLEDEGWTELQTEFVGEDARSYWFESESPGLSAFAIGANAPIFEIGEVEFPDGEYHLGDTITVSALVTNVGSLEGNFTGELRLGGTAVETESVVLSPGTEETVTFETTLEDEGSVDLAVNEALAGTVTVIDDSLPTEFWYLFAVFLVSMVALGRFVSGLDPGDEFEVVEDVPGRTLAVTVENQDGERLGGASVHLERLEDGRARSRTGARTQWALRHGTEDFGREPALDTTAVSATLVGHASLAAQAVADEIEAVRRARWDARMAAEERGEDEPATLDAVGIADESDPGYHGETDEDGTVTFENLEAGTYAISSTHGKTVAGDAVDLDDDRALTLALDEHVIVHDDVRLEWLGHASVRIEAADGTVIYLDPWGTALDENPVTADVVLVSHDDRDHYDPAAVEAVSGPETMVGIYEGVDTSALSMDREVVSLPYDGVTVVGGVYVRAIPAYNDPNGNHVDDHGRPFHGERDGIGFVLTVGETTIAFPADTDFLPHHGSLSADVFLPPIGGQYTMDRHGAAAFARSLEPELVIPIHYDTFEAIEADPAAFAAELADDDVTVVVTDPSP